MNDVDVVVAGGGIGGLATALALSRTGRSVRVLERSETFAELGAGLQLAPNATRILGEWGLQDAVVDVGVLPQRLVFRDALDGEELTSAPLGRQIWRHYGAPYVVVHRSDLLTILLEACRDGGVDLVADCEVHDVDVDRAGVVVHSTCGDHTAAAAIAADGLRSTLRSRLSDDDPICSGFVAYRGALPIGDLARELDPWAMREVSIHIGPGCHLVQYPLRRGEVFNTVAVFESREFAAGVTDWGGPDELDRAFTGACPAVRRGLESLWRDRRWPMFDRLPVDRWVDGRLALIGDAAHPMLQYLAQGACQAIEDAACVARETSTLADTDGWPAALTSYQNVRRDRTARVQRNARLWGDIWHVNGVGRLIRNELFRQRTPDDYSYADWLYA